MPQHFGRTATHLVFYQVAHYDDERSTLSSLQLCTCIKFKSEKKGKEIKGGKVAPFYFVFQLDFYLQTRRKRRGRRGGVRCGGVGLTIYQQSKY